jgi:formylglycine-generating enzyme required for sulfatase activity
MMMLSPMLNGLEKRLPTEAEWEFASEEGERVVIFMGKHT